MSSENFKKQFYGHILGSLLGDRINFHQHDTIQERTEFIKDELSSLKKRTIYNPERDETLIKDLYLKRLMSTYQRSYCSSVGKKSLVIDPDNLDEDQFMVYFNKYYTNRTQPLPRPLYTSRRVFGYSRFENYYTGLTTYQEAIGRPAYEYFKKDYDQGKSRLYRKKQQEKHKIKEVRSKESEQNAQKSEPEKPKPETTGLQTSKLLMPESKSMKPHSSYKTKEKICCLCCEKFGDFSFAPSIIRDKI